MPLKLTVYKDGEPVVTYPAFIPQAVKEIYKAGFHEELKAVTLRRHIATDGRYVKRGASDTVHWMLEQEGATLDANHLPSMKQYTILNSASGKLNTAQKHLTALPVPQLSPDKLAAFLLTLEQHQQVVAQTIATIQQQLAAGPE